MTVAPTESNRSSDEDGATVMTLELAGLSKRFGSTQALDEVDLSAAPGEIHALIGGNGSGKSTLIKILAGVESADAGSLTVNGEELDLDRHSPARAQVAGLHFVHQQNTTFPDLTVAENLSLGRGFESGPIGGIRWRRVRDRARRTLERFEIEAEPNQRLSTLGPASQVMIAIARVLQDQGEEAGGLLVLDEPTASLPTHEVDLLLTSLRRFSTQGQAILYVSHRLEEVVRVADRVTVLRDGRLIDTFPSTGVSQRKLAELIVGSPLEVEKTTAAGPAGEPVLEAENLADGDLSITLRAGEVVGIAGLLGSGRSRIIRQLFGLEASGARVRIDSEQVEMSSPLAAMRAGVAQVPDDRLQKAAFPTLSVSDNIGIADLPAHGRAGGISGASERRRARQLIEELGIKTASERSPIANLSGGNQQKVILARWLQREPRVLLLDEPTQGVDIGARHEIHRVIRGVVGRGATALMVSSDFDELALHCDRILVVAEGRVTATLAGEDLSEKSINDAVYGEE
jgi:ribose transport system ATP-binding protein